MRTALVAGVLGLVCATAAGAGSLPVTGPPRPSACACEFHWKELYLLAWVYDPAKAGKWFATNQSYPLRDLCEVLEAMQENHSDYFSLWQEYVPTSIFTIGAREADGCNYLRLVYPA